MRILNIVLALNIFATTFSLRASLSARRLLPTATTTVTTTVTKSSLRMSSTGDKNIPSTPEGWRTVLSPSQFRVLREKGTEPPGYSESTVGELEYELKKQVGTKYPTEGSFDCVACGTPLYKATSKFDSGCGWPAFYEGYPGAIKELPDADGRRIEIVCNNCGSHLGHVFKGEGFPTPTNERYVHTFVIILQHCFLMNTEQKATVLERLVRSSDFY